MHCQRLDTVTNTLEAVGGGMEFSCRFRYPTNYDLTVAISEARDLTWKVTRKLLLQLCQRHRYQRLAVKLRRPAGKYTCAARRLFRLRGDQRYQPGDDTRNYVDE